MAKEREPAGDDELGALTADELRERLRTTIGAQRGSDRKVMELQQEVERLKGETAAAAGQQQPLVEALGELAGVRRELSRRKAALEAAVKEGLPASVALAIVADDADIERSVRTVSDYVKGAENKARNVSLATGGAPAPLAGDKGPRLPRTLAELEAMSDADQALVPQTWRNRLFQVGK